MDAGATFDAALAGAQAGDETAFAVLYRTSQPALLRYLRVLAGSDADDVAGETWLQVVRDLPHFAGDEPSFRAWLFTIARHRLVDQRRWEARRPAVPVDEVHDGARPVHSGGGASAADPADTVVAAVDTAGALALIASLPPDQAEAVYLRAVAGLDVAAVAELMARSAGAVRVLTHRGLQTLAARLDAEAAAAFEGRDS